MKDNNTEKRGLFRRHRRSGGTLDRFEIALTSIGVAALRRKPETVQSNVPPAPARMLSDGVGVFTLGVR